MPLVTMLQVGSALGLGLLLLTAAVLKSATFPQFVRVVESLGVVRDDRTARVARGVIAIEALIGAGLAIAVFDLTSARAAAVAATGLFLLFAVVLAIKLGGTRAQRRDGAAAGCGCFGRTGKLTWSLPVRNIGLALISAAIFLYQGTWILFGLGAAVIGAALLIREEVRHGAAAERGPARA